MKKNVSASPSFGARLAVGLSLSLCAAAPVVAAAAQGHSQHSNAKSAAPMHSCRSRYGGPCYDGAPNLQLVASLVAAGGGPHHFSSARALTAMAGKTVAKQELARLTKTYGSARIDNWIKVFDFVVNDASSIAGHAGIVLPKPHMRGTALASSLVQNGLVDKTFYIEYMLDRAVSHRIHEKVMDDIDSKFGPSANAFYHKISNRAMYDLAHALGVRGTRLSPFH